MFVLTNFTLHLEQLLLDITLCIKGHQLQKQACFCNFLHNVINQARLSDHEQNRICNNIIIANMSCVYTPALCVQDAFDLKFHISHIKRGSIHVAI